MLIVGNRGLWSLVNGHVYRLLGGWHNASIVLICSWFWLEVAEKRKKIL